MTSQGTPFRQALKVIGTSKPRYFASFTDFGNFLQDDGPYHLEVTSGTKANYRIHWMLFEAYRNDDGNQVRVIDSGSGDGEVTMTLPV